MSDQDDIDPDAPASAEEIAASQRLRDALGGKEAAGAASTPEVELALSLRAAWDPSPLSADENRAVLDATPSAEEQQLAIRLRDALAKRREPRDGDSIDVQLAHALRTAFSPLAIDAAEHRAIVDAALAKMPGAKVGGDVVQLAARRRATVVRVAFGVVAGGLVARHLAWRATDKIHA